MRTAVWISIAKFLKTRLRQKSLAKGPVRTGDGTTLQVMLRGGPACKHNQVTFDAFTNTVGIRYTLTWPCLTIPRACSYRHHHRDTGKRGKNTYILHSRIGDMHVKIYPLPLEETFKKRLALAESR